MSKSLRYLDDGENFSFDHAKVHSPTKGYADGGMVTPGAPQAPMGPRKSPVGSDAIAGKAALGAFLLGQAKGAQDAKSAMPKAGAKQGVAPRAPSNQMTPIPGGGYAKGGKVKAKFIQGAIKHKGALHRDLGVPEGEKIPDGKLAAAAKRPGKVGQRARFAETLKGMPHHAKGGVVKGADPADVAEDKKMVKSGVRQHEDHEHGGKHTDLKLARGGMVNPHRPHKPHAASAAPKRMRGPVMPSSEPMPAEAAPAMPMGRMSRRGTAAPPMGPMEPQAMPGAMGADQTDGVPQLARGGKMRSRC